MPSPFAITAATNTVSLDNNRQGQTSFTVSNTTGRAIRGRAHLVAQPATAGPWVTLVGEAERDFASTGSQQYTVQITVPPSAPVSDYTFRLDVVDVANPDENFSEGPTIKFAVAPPPPVKKPFPWWIVAVIVGVVILVGGGFYGIYQVLQNAATATAQANVRATATAQANATATAQANVHATATAQANAIATATALAAAPPQTPTQLSPSNGSVFHNFPRTTTLQWSAVAKAVSYTVEIDCYQCCAVNQWCTDVGKTWSLVSDIKQTTYTFNFVGAQPGRWRVLAVDASGQKSPVSGWWTFTYTV